MLNQVQSHFDLEIKSFWYSELYSCDKQLLVTSPSGRSTGTLKYNENLCCLLASLILVTMANELSTAIARRIFCTNHCCSVCHSFVVLWLKSTTKPICLQHLQFYVWCTDIPNIVIRMMLLNILYVILPFRQQTTLISKDFLMLHVRLWQIWLKVRVRPSIRWQEWLDNNDNATVLPWKIIGNISNLQCSDFFVLL